MCNITEKKGKKRLRPPVSLSASYTSTIAEETVALLRKLHTLEMWNPIINSYIMHQMALIANFVQVTPDQKARGPCSAIITLKSSPTYEIAIGSRCIYDTKLCSRYFKTGFGGCFLNACHFHIVMQLHYIYTANHDLMIV